MREGRLGYNSYNKRYGLLSSDLWIDTGFHCGEYLEVLLDDEWFQTRMEMNPAREWYLVGTPYCGDSVSYTHLDVYKRQYQVPIEVRADRRQALALRWITLYLSLIHI